MSGAAVALLSGAAGSAISTLAFYPLELVKVRRASAVGRQRSAVQLASHLLQHGDLYQGCGVSLFKNVLTDALYFGWQAKLAEAAVKRLRGRALGAVESLICGYIAACLTQLVAQYGPLSVRT